MGVPKIIHQMWFDKKISDNEEPCQRKELYLKYMKTWRDHHPDYQYIFWNRDKIEELWSHPKLERWLPFFEEKIERHIEKCDFTRYAIMYIYGGIYADLDFECLHPFDDLLDRDLGLAEEPPEHNFHYIINGVQKLVFNGLLLSSKGNTFWPELMDDIVLHYNPNTTVMLTTGPGFVGYYVKKKPIELMNTCLFLKRSSFGDSYACRGTSVKEYARTYWNEGTGWGMEEALKKWVPRIAAIIILIVLLYGVLKNLSK